MIAFAAGVRVWLATGHTDMRKGFGSLALLVQETLQRDPHGGHVFVFRGKRSDLVKIIDPRAWLADVLARLPITLPGASTNSCPGIGARPTPSPRGPRSAAASYSARAERGSPDAYD